MALPYILLAGETVTTPNNRTYINFYLFIYLFSVIGLLPGGSGYFTCKQIMKLVTTRFKSGGVHEKHVVATWNLGNHLSRNLGNNLSMGTISYQQ